MAIANLCLLVCKTPSSTLEEYISFYGACALQLRVVGNLCSSRGDSWLILSVAGAYLGLRDRGLALKESTHQENVVLDPANRDVLCILVCLCREVYDVS